MRLLALFVALVAASAAAAQDYDRNGMVEFGPFFVDPARPTILFLDGEVPEGAEAHFGRAVAAYPSIRTIVLNSLGGSMESGELIGRQVASLGAETVVPPGGHCESACAMIYFAGRPRNVRGTLGVHQFQPYEDIGSEAVLLSAARILNYLLDYDVDPALMVALLSTPFEDMYILTREEIALWGLEIGEVQTEIEAALTPDEFIDMLAGVFADPETLLKPILDSGAVPDRLQPRFIAYMHTVFGHPQAIAYFADGLTPYLGDDIYGADLDELMFGLGSRLSALGLTRLSPEQLQENFAFGRDMAAWLLETSPELCLAFGAEALSSDAEAIAFGFLATRDDAYVERYFAVVTAAGLAELEDNPPRRLLDARRLRAAESAYETAFIDAVLAHPLQDQLIDAIIGNGDVAADVYCELVVLSAAAIEAVPSGVRDDVYLFLSQPE